MGQCLISSDVFLGLFKLIYYSLSRHHSKRRDHLWIDGTQLALTTKDNTISTKTNHGASRHCICRNYDLNICKL